LGDNIAAVVQLPSNLLTYRWYTTPTGGTPFFTGIAFPINGFTGAVTFYVESFNGICPSTSRFPVTIQLAPSPTASFTSNPPPSEQVNLPIDSTRLHQFTSTSVGSVREVWYFAEAETLTGSQVRYRFTQPGRQRVRLIVYNAEGCADTSDVFYVITDDFFVDVPSAFIPGNPRNPANAIFSWLAKGWTTATMSIYSRWGARVYNRNFEFQEGAQDFWNGKVDNTGDDCPEGVYVWTLELNSVNNRTIVKRGTVTLIR
jgi:hypothetical protein